MRIGIFDPYLDTLGGGEKYILSIASILSNEHDVFLFWDNNEDLKKGSERFHLDLSKIHTTKNLFSKKSSFPERFKQTRSYDAILYMSDGSIPFLFAKKNFLLFQFPTPWVHKNLIDSVKLKTISSILCYSDFVRNFLRKEFSQKIVVLAPPIDIPKEISKKKENIILSVGRFTKGMNTKKQADMITSFKELCDTGVKDWKLVLAGGALKEDGDFVTDLKNSTKGYPIEIYENISYEKLLSFYAKAKIYWHAAGFGEDLFRHPERAEHFGITTLEAMSHGVVPIVFHGGGQVEIVTENVGFTWNNVEDLLTTTKKVMKEEKLREDLSSRAIEQAKEFSIDVFQKRVKELFV